MRLTADVIARSPAFLNALKDRELDLRGNKISVIENLAATQDQFDSIDLSDNEILKVECMAHLPRLSQRALACCPAWLNMCRPLTRRRGMRTTAC